MAHSFLSFYGICTVSQLSFHALLPLKVSACNVGDYQFKLILQLYSISISLDTRAVGEWLKCSTEARGELEWSRAEERKRDANNGEDKQTHVARWTEAEREGGEVEEG